MNARACNDNASCRRWGKVDRSKKAGDDVTICGYLRFNGD